MRRALCAVLLSALAACAHTGFGSDRGAGNVLRIADLANPTSLNPLLAHDQETIGNDLLSVQTLTGLDERNRVVPILLTQVPDKRNGGVSADGTTITYHLRHGVRFADGVEFTSADVGFTYRAIIDKRNPVLTQDTYRRIASLTTPDRYTVVVRLKKPWNAAVRDLFAQSDFAFGILPAHAFKSTVVAGADWENRAFGTGPFRVTEWRRGDRIVLEPNPYFSPKPRVGRIELRMIPNYNTGFIALRTHDVDVATLRSVQLVQAAEHTPGITILRTPLNDTEFLDLQTQASPTNRYEVRRAIAYALNMGSLMKVVGGMYPQAGSFLPPVMADMFDGSIRPYPHDPLVARGLNGNRHIGLTIIIQAENEVARRIASVVQQQLNEAGFDAQIKPVSTALFNAPEGPERNGRFAISVGAWLGGSDPEQSVVFTCDRANVNGDNISRFCDPQFDAAYADQATAQDPARRHRDFITMQRILHDRIPTIPLYYETWFDGVNEHVHGFARNMLEYPVAPERWSKD